MSCETEILSALETQNFVLSQIVQLLESINDKISDIDGNLDVLTGNGTDTITDLKGAMNDVKSSVENLKSN